MNSLNVVDFNIDIDSLQTDFETSCENSYDFHWLSVNEFHKGTNGNASLPSFE